ncbi:unnamed protein product [Nyctereutes procyonoides]|uniref:C-X-C motif chemokine n=1 Tax=Nyctereutes procyonoides TaxID=34880 RepID=A0A811XW34_NYCPR|nr:unnamed protein product [Nyctereutes procyonoides]
MAVESSQTLLLLAVLALSIFTTRCQCIQTHSDFVSPKFITNVQLIPEGAHCSRKEIIVTLKDEKLICLDPEAEWVMIIIKKITNSAPN